ncbi:hypothetical protein [Pseudarthrobacter sulfonivorans]|uniref:hypothetical protein n=1 Tax=Pseudarthrobacter sulfonivorans TaxID=121292 RepID=UPI002857445A|nr:hypothetical protein [Pseudarthrobacter sulfonivorans]MDR6413474.1 hypothetical protein [Pseudarthrobacter sulfonivorans]
MEFESSLWGTVGQWASAVFAGLAFFATFYVIRRDSKLRRTSQARRIVYYFSYFIPGEPMEDRWFHIRNNSDESVYDVHFYYHIGRYIEQGARQVLHPGEETKYRSLEVPRISFRDGAGVSWLRNIEGDLKTGRPKYSKWFRQHRRMLQKKPS